MAILIMAISIIIFAFILGLFKQMTISHNRDRLDSIIKKLRDSYGECPEYIMTELSSRASDIQRRLVENEYRSFNTTNRQDRRDKYTDTTKQLVMEIDQLERDIKNVF